MQQKNHRINCTTRGFTLIEIMIYVAIFTMMITATSIFSIDLIKAKNKTSIKRETQENTRIVFDQIASEARFANTATTPTSEKLTLNTASGTVSFYRQSIDASHSAVVMEIGGSILQITNDDVDVVTLSFSIRDLSVPGVWISITVEDNFPSPKAEFRSSESFRSYINLRSNSKPVT